MTAGRMNREEYEAGLAEREKFAASVRNRPKLTREEICARIANPKQRMPVTGHPMDPRPKVKVMTETENIRAPGLSGTPRLATEHQISAVSNAMMNGERFPVAEGPPWQSTVAKAVESYAYWFESAPDRKPIGYDMPPTDLDEYERRWNARPPKLGLFVQDNLPLTHDNHDAVAEGLIPPWNPAGELDISVVISTSRPGHRWLERGTTTVETVMDEVRDDQHCDLGYGCCTARSRPSSFNVFPFSFGDLTVITHGCRDCWQQWVNEQIPEPPDELICETDIE